MSVKEICECCGCEIENGWTYDVRVGEHNHVTVCQDCIDNFEVCERCGEHVDPNDIVGGYMCGYMCSWCFDEFSNNWVKRTNPIEEYHAHHALDPIFHEMESQRTAKSGDLLYMGVELEVDGKFDSRGNRSETALAMASRLPDNFIYFEEDGSLSNGFECITQPATLEYHQSLIDEYQKAFATVRRAGFRSHNTRSCGFHVHVNTNYFPADNRELYIARLCYIVEKFWDELVVFSRRNIQNMKTWAQKFNEGYEEVAKQWKTDKYRLSRTSAVNLLNDNTIEFRMFRGTLKTNTFIATLQLVEAICSTALNRTVEEIQCMSFEDLLNFDECRSYWIEAQTRAKEREERKNQISEAV